MKTKQKFKPTRIVRQKFKTGIHEILVVESTSTNPVQLSFSVMFITKNHFAGMTEVKACIQSMVFLKYENALEQAFKWVSEIAAEYIRNGAT